MLRAMVSDARGQRSYSPYRGIGPPFGALSFSRDLGKLRETAAQSGERLRATEKRALPAIDRERGAGREAAEGTRRNHEAGRPA